MRLRRATAGGPPGRPAAAQRPGRLQKDTGLISILGRRSTRSAQAQIETARDVNFTPYVVAGMLFVLLTIPMTRVTDAIARRYGWTAQGGTV